MRKIKGVKELLSAFLAFCLLFASVLFAVPASAATSITITSPTSGASVTGSSFTVTGTATANRTITVEVNGSSVGTTTSDGSGDWSLSVTGQNVGAKTIEATATGQVLYGNVLNVGDFSASRMTIINMLTETEEDTFSIFGGGAFPITWKPNQSFTQAYGVAPYLNSGTVWDMDLTTGTVTTFTLPGVGQRGAAIAYNQDASKVYITDNANTDVIVYDTSDNSQIGSAISIGSAPHSNMMRPGTDEIWVLNSSDDTISVIDSVTDTVTDTYAVAESPNGLTFSPDGQTAYVGQDAPGSGAVLVIDGDTGATTDTIAASGYAEYMLMSADGSTLYASHPLQNNVDVYDTATATLTETIDVADGPWGLALNNDNSRLYVSSPDLVGGLSGTDISVVDTATNTIIGTITPGSGAPFYLWSAPQETDTDSISITLASAESSDEDQLADTGVSPLLPTTAGTVLSLLGIFGIANALRHRHGKRY